MLMLYNAIHRWIKAAEFLFMLAAGVALFIIMLITVIDVVFRYVLNAPLHFSTSLVTIYLFPCIVFLSLSDTFYKNENVEIDIVANLMPNWFRRTGKIVGMAGGLVVFLIISYLYFIQTQNAYNSGEFVFGAINWIRWPSWLIVALGAALLSLRLAHQIIGEMCRIEKSNEGYDPEVDSV